MNLLYLIVFSIFFGASKPKWTTFGNIHFQTSFNENFFKKQEYTEILPVIQISNFFRVWMIQKMYALIFTLFISRWYYTLKIITIVLHLQLIALMMQCWLLGQVSVVFFVKVKFLDEKLKRSLTQILVLSTRNIMHENSFIPSGTPFSLLF